ncbi:hypothetical protein AMS68_003494 [Peltaster fructicola]|uniref:Uncharacterized protein n=1 Tax=Peltaster fructicola TaxID=286661 RepID=A0A6H0XT86_9PEZI|nr:hypothetical protein AMS68_003494 [Peltaster fructicola]
MSELPQPNTSRSLRHKTAFLGKPVLSDQGFNDDRDDGSAQVERTKSAPVEEKDVTHKATQSRKAQISATDADWAAITTTPNAKSLLSMVKAELKDQRAKKTPLLRISSDKLPTSADEKAYLRNSRQAYSDGPEHSPGLLDEARALKSRPVDDGQTPTAEPPYPTAVSPALQFIDTETPWNEFVQSSMSDGGFALANTPAPKPPYPSSPLLQPIRAVSSSPRYDRSLATAHAEDRSDQHTISRSVSGTLMDMSTGPSQSDSSDAAGTCRSFTIPHRSKQDASSAWSAQWFTQGDAEHAAYVNAAGHAGSSNNHLGNGLSAVGLGKRSRPKMSGSGPSRSRDASQAKRVNIDDEVDSADDNDENEVQMCCPIQDCYGTNRRISELLRDLLARHKIFLCFHCCDIVNIGHGERPADAKNRHANEGCTPRCVGTHCGPIENPPWLSLAHDPDSNCKRSWRGMPKDHLWRFIYAKVWNTNNVPPVKYERGSGYQHSNQLQPRRPRYPRQESNTRRMSPEPLVSQLEMDMTRQQEQAQLERQQAQQMLMQSQARANELEYILMAVLELEIPQALDALPRSRVADILSRSLRFRIQQEAHRALPETQAGDRRPSDRTVRSLVPIEMEHISPFYASQPSQMNPLPYTTQGNYNLIETPDLTDQPFGLIGSAVSWLPALRET